MEETKATEAKIEAIAPQQEVDYEAVIKQKDEELAQVAKEKENYRKAYLKKAGGQPEESLGDDKPEQEEVMRRIVREEMLQTREVQLQAEKDAVITAQSKRLKELEVALKNRGQIVSTSGGSNQDKPEVKIDTYFSNEQLAELKKRGYDDKKIEVLRKNMTKVKEMPINN